MLGLLSPSGSQEPVGIKNKGLAREDRSFILFRRCHPSTSVAHNYQSNKTGVAIVLRITYS